MGVTWDRAISQLYANMTPLEVIGAAETWENPFLSCLTITSDVNYNHTGILPWHLTHSIMLPNKTIKYIHHRRTQKHTHAFISKEKTEEFVLCLHNTERPLNKVLNPLAAAETQLSIKYKRMRHIRRLQLVRV